MEVSTAPAALPIAVGERGVCVAGDPHEAEAGAQMLEAGGNAVDAVVAAAFMAFVVEQLDCGLGGFVHVSAWLPGSERALAVDGYVRAPAGAHAEMFAPATADATVYGHPPTRGDRARFGGLAVALPGAVAGLCEAHAAGGRLPLPEVLHPAIDRARLGIPVTWRDVLAIAPLAARIATMPDTAAELLPGGGVPPIAVQHPTGHRRDGTALAGTLQAVADRGPAAFYTGDVARALVAAVRGAGGILTTDDLAAYRATVSSPRPIRYRDAAIDTCFDHVTHEALQILEGIDVPALDPDGDAYRHIVAEALGVAFTDGIAHYDDPALGSPVVPALRSRAFADLRRGALGPTARPRPIGAGDPWPLVDSGRAQPSPGRWRFSGTSSMVAADRDGTVASVITATGWNYGSLVYVPAVGTFLNNAMSYFDPRPGRAASIAPGKTPMFGAPAVVAVRDDGERLAIAGSGGYRIVTGVLHTLLGRIDHGMSLSAALAHPRVHCQGRETFVDARIPDAVRRALTDRGHDVVALVEDAGSCHFGRIAAASVERDGTVLGTAGPVWTTAVATA